MSRSPLSTRSGEAAKARSRAWIGLGGNIGDVEAAMRAAVAHLGGHERIDVEAVSALYSTPPWGVTDQPGFLNACTRLITDLRPEALLDVCLAAEAAQDRVREQKWGPRTIDLDILAFEAGSYSSARLQVPHPRLAERAFALAPLADLDPGLLVGGRTVSQWLAECDTSGIEQLKSAVDWADLD